MKFGGPAKLKKSCMLKKCKVMTNAKGTITKEPNTKASGVDNIPANTGNVYIYIYSYCMG